jgi:hypothetical protein
MANDITAPHLWKLDTAGLVKAAGTKIKITHVIFAPAVAADDLVLQEYAADGSTLKDFSVLKAGAADVDWIKDDFGPDGLEVNGLYVGTIDGGTAYVHVKG